MSKRDMSLDIVNKLRNDCIREGFDPAEGIVILLEAAMIISQVLRIDINPFDVMRGTLDAIESSRKN